ncbi:hypothetical protein CEXT_354611 [Caerostris extrusa]|uniref:Uncharacterized protein n=1 Tax=Caerostris extrusa TaxID=172846 RepID=A0AAV4R854_CAEEX|nr:hypothetical protein CEXT_354611 [Caerostris extrusa]
MHSKLFNKHLKVLITPCGKLDTVLRNVTDSIPLVKPFFVLVICFLSDRSRRRFFERALPKIDFLEALLSGRPVEIGMDHFRNRT